MRQLNTLVCFLSLTLIFFIDSSFAEESINQKATCKFTIGFSRSDHGTEEYHKRVAQGYLGDKFHFEGCSTSSQDGQKCVNYWHVPAGIRLIKNQRGEVVAEGNCCNEVINKITSVTSSCVNLGGPSPSCSP